jgi:hypothetical protein
MSTPYDAMNSAFSTQAANITTAINTNLPVALGVAGLILGLSVVWRFAKRFVKG